MAGSTDDDEHLTNPGGQFADEGSPQNGKSRDWVQGAGMGGTKAQAHADRRGKTGKGMVDKGAPNPGPAPRSSQ